MRALTKYFFLICFLFLLAAIVYPPPTVEEVYACFNRIAEKGECLDLLDEFHECVEGNDDCSEINRQLKECTDKREPIENCYGNGVSGYMIFFSALCATAGIGLYFDERIAPKKNKKK